MRLINTVFISFLIVFQSCVKDNSIQFFSSSTDTLLISTKTIKGKGLFPISEGSEKFEDITANFEYSVILPKNLNKIKRAQRFVDLKASRYHNYKISGSDTFPSYIIEDIKNKKLDTSEYIHPENNYIDIITGMIEQERVYIVDENHNKDFRDDSVRTFQPVDAETVENVVRCKFMIYNGVRIVNDFTWINIEQFSDYSGFWFSVYEHLVGEFYIDSDYFKIGISDEQSGFPYQYPTFALLATDSSIKDTLLQKDILYLNEYININSSYYRLDNVSNNGDFLTLIKEDNFDKKIGTQVGMLAPDFKCISITGDTISSTNLHHKLIVIANICGCGGDTETSIEYSKMVNKYGDDIHIIGMDSKIDVDLGGYLIDTEIRYNKDFYFEYRNAYCSRTCYVIDKNNRIIDKFQTRDWSLNLPKHIDNIKQESENE